MIKPRIASDLEAYLLFDNKNTENIYCIGSITFDRYIEAQEANKDAIMQAAGYFDGEHTLSEIDDFLQSDHNLKLDVYKLNSLFEHAGLITNADIEYDNKNELEKHGIQIASVSLSRFQNMFSILAKSSHSLLLTGFLLCIASLPLIPGVFKELLFVNIYKIVDSSTVSLIISLAVTTISVLLHEISHAVAAKKYGLIPKQMKITLYLYLNPMAYILTNGIYTLERKKRAFIWVAGILCNFMIFAAAAIGQYFSEGTLHSLFLVICYSNLGLIVTNLIPFLPLDGYFLLTTLLKFPNLRKKSFSGIKGLLNNRSIKVKGIYIMYYTISISILIYIVLTPIIQVYHNFLKGYSSQHYWLDGLAEIKMYLIIMMIIVFSRISVKIKDKRKKIFVKVP
ncbi:hypothetical protein QW71_30200 [Paenibacillus sp. IHB B 3415]|uniref:metalloprotease n=1 Tax=Paenibacillus sp. IHB B 3415 TaxID=867080 RepID=UPI000574B8A7|nr:hypothetical protein [Paenibacillus sp. IHB B 3415]KHL92271.1 hypothetical protein QW71_30200 [Paenibacillus sp. IHB B 3415]